MRITGLRLRQLTGIMEHEQPFWEERLARPIDVYPEHKARTAADGYWMPQPIDARALPRHLGLSRDRHR